MSELQISLLGLGVVVVLVIYIYGWWQQRNYQKKYRETFKQDHADILYAAPEGKSRQESSSAQEVIQLGTAASAAPSISTPPLSPIFSDQQKLSNTVFMESACALLSDVTDYIVEIKLAKPTGVERLSSLWRRRFDFGHDVTICGLNVENNTWEKVVADSTLSYAAFKLALQLVKRSGAVSEPKLARFKDVISSISNKPADHLILPDVGGAAARALQLDEFCVTVDRIIGLNLLPDNRHQISGTEVAAVGEQHGLSLQADGTFHSLDKRGNSLYSLASIDSIPFQYHTLGQRSVSGLTLLLDVPLTEQPAQRFDQMVEVAHKMAKQFKASMMDDHRKLLGEESIVLIRGQIVDIEARMSERQIVPGGAQARRLFS